MLDVEVEGERYQEMHVDGGAVAQTFLVPPSFVTTVKDRDLLSDRGRHICVIRNARLDPQWASVERRTLSIFGRATSTLLQSQGYGDLLRTYMVSEEVDADFNLAFIPQEFNFPHREQFDTDYMRALFQLAYERAHGGYPWHKKPPGVQAHRPAASSQEEARR